MYNTRSKAEAIGVDTNWTGKPTAPANPPTLTPPRTIDRSADVGGEVSKSSQTELARPGNLVNSEETGTSLVAVADHPGRIRHTGAQRGASKASNASSASKASNASSSLASNSQKSVSFSVESDTRPLSRSGIGRGVAVYPPPGSTTLSTSTPIPLTSSTAFPVATPPAAVQAEAVIPEQARHTYSQLPRMEVSDIDYSSDEASPYRRDSRRNSTLRRRSTAMKPTKFDGSMSVDTFLIQFETCAEYNEWDEREKVANLKCSLAGTTGQILWECGDPSKLTYSGLRDKLQARYGATGQGLFLSKLRARRRKPNESLAELYRNI